MKKVLLVFTTALMASYGIAQDKTVQDLRKDAAREIKKVKDPNDTIPKTWKTGGLYSLTINQGALSNWAAGGDKSSLAVTSFLNLFAFYKNGKNAWDNNLDVAYGFVNTTSLGSRKADDRIDLLSKYGYEVAKKWYASALFNFRSQFTKGYSYPADGPKVLTSDFLAPAYILLALGMDYKPNDNFSLFISPITSRWVLVNNDSLSAQGAFGVEPGKKSKNEIGAYVSANYKADISPNATFKSRLDLFSNYRSNPQNIDLFMTNILAVKVWKFISVNISVDVIYDDDTKSIDKDGNEAGPKVQLKELMGIGFSYKF
jgi:Protein of unknown function (DUF3078)